MQKKKVTILGGGTGSIAVISGLKEYPDLDIRVVVNMTDDGGSNAVVRDEFGLLPLSDVRKSIIALAKTDDPILRQIFTYRFSKGDGLTGHTLGNLIMMGLSEITGSETGAIEAVSKLFLLQGKVIPVTLAQTHLVAEYSDGTRVKSEHLIDEPEETNKTITKLSVEPKVDANREAINAILDADYIIAGPGDLYTTTLANIVIDGIPKAIQQCQGKFIFVNNLMTKKGQTQGMSAKDIVHEIERYIGRCPDAIIQNNGDIPKTALEKYVETGESVIEDDLEEKCLIIRADVVGGETEKQKGDILVRSFVRHDPKKLGDELYNLIVKK